jgi:hypothetical protein
MKRFFSVLRKMIAYPILALGVLLQEVADLIAGDIFDE